MFAGKFAAGAGAFECRLRQIDLSLVEKLGAAFAFAPECAPGAAKTRPMARISESTSGFRRAGVWRKSDNLIRVPGQSHPIDILAYGCGLDVVCNISVNAP